MRISSVISVVGIVAIAMGLAACDRLGLGNPSSPSGPGGPLTTANPIVYTAVGASDVIGYGSSKTCLPFEDCNGNGYVWVVARQLRSQGFTVNVQQLGIPTGVLSRTFQDLGNQYGHDVFGNFIQQEMPFVTHEATAVTVLAGANDVNTITAALGGGAGAGNQAGYIDQMVATFGAEFSTLLSGIRARAPAARIVVLNLPNLGARPYLAGASLAQRQAAQRASVRITTTVINPSPNITVIDLMCDTRINQAPTISSDGFHPNDQGYALIGAEIVSALTSPSYPAPKSSCSQMTAIP